MSHCIRLRRPWSRTTHFRAASQEPPSSDSNQSVVDVPDRTPLVLRDPTDDTNDTCQPVTVVYRRHFNQPPGWNASESTDRVWLEIAPGCARVTSVRFNDVEVAVPPPRDPASEDSVQIEITESWRAYNSLSIELSGPLHRDDESQPWLGEVQLRIVES